MASENIKNIVIVGGGTSGWMAAATLIKFFPQKHITLIESKDIPIIGVGESTTAFINNWLKILGIQDKDFMKECDATYKLSIKFNDFSYLGDGGFHYPFGTPFVEGTSWGLWDWHLIKHKNPDIHVEDFARSYFPAAALYETNKISENKDKSFENFNFDLDLAYHFDAMKFGKWLREKYAKPKGVKHIVATVEKINTDDNGISELILDNGDSIKADLFVDCTGFKSILLEGAMGVPFESYEDNLINNRAWATPLQYQDKEAEMQPFTNCTALGNGWVWNTPLYSRIGTGYVYSTKHITEEEALEEFKQYLMSDKMVVPRSKEEVDSLPFRKVFMKTGIHSKVWEKNVVGIGLSAGFIEPLESNGLYSVHELLFKLVRILLTPKINQFDKDMFNTSARQIVKNFSEFVGMHYALTNRDDTDYWKEISNKEFSKDMLLGKGNFAAGYQNFEDLFMFRNDFQDLISGINFISTGMGYQMVDDYIIKTKELYFPQQNYDLMAEEMKIKFKIKKEKWEKAAKKELSMYEYLKKYIYKD